MNRSTIHPPQLEPPRNAGTVRPGDLLEAAYRKFRVQPTDETLVDLLAKAMDYRADQRVGPLLDLRNNSDFPVRLVGQPQSYDKVQQRSKPEDRVPAWMQRVAQKPAGTKIEWADLLDVTAAFALERARKGSGDPTDFGWVPCDHIEGDFYSIRVEVDEALTPDQIRRLSGCLGYALRAELAGEDLSDPQDVVVERAPADCPKCKGGGTEWEEMRNWPCSACGGNRTVIIFSYDSTKSRRDDPDFFTAFERAAEYIYDGTPVRKTNRAGAGTAGTRLVEGIGEGCATFWVQ